MIPEFMPKLVLVAVNEPIEAGDPLNCIFETVTPCPSNTF
jgi:hypothetical protein